ncbi:YaiI/YqxD family protein [Sphingobium sp. PNB]|uniref:YaiI/YqxD family protein n=1 Tax=Sphingobium sp. PNB TaxID=863934 RepID=UPI001CA45DA9|nr:YaiI/YqxD family protein [Sphingobium sp. PNB]MCB4858189.1 YaiI/YqxD family protein [Sphingobium sp. PNB]
MPQTKTPNILIDADACPVKEETYKVAWRHGVPVIVVSNSPIRVPAHPLVSRIVVGEGFDAADDWIAGHVDAGSIIVTADILLADRCLKAGCGAVIAPTGKPFTHASIGNAVAVRAIKADLRAGILADGVGGPAPFAKADRSRFLSALDEAVVRLRRR